jgi:hypothetical protein
LVIVRFPATGRHRELLDFNEGSREILLDTGNYSVDQYLQAVFSSFELL